MPAATSSVEPAVPGRVRDVERLLQVLAVLRHSEGAVPRAALVEAVAEYRQDDAAVQAAEPQDRERKQAALTRKIANDVGRLVELGFDVSTSGEQGVEGAWTLRPTPWRVPLQLTEQESAVLAWVMRAGVPAPEALPQDVRRPSLTSLAGDLPSGLGLVHVALAGRRRLVVDREEGEKVVEPVQLASFEGRWYLLVRYPGSARVYGYRLDRLDVLRLGEVMEQPPEPVEDPRAVLDPTGWTVDDPLDVELRCLAEDRAQVAPWFPRAVSVASGAEAVLTFRSTHHAAVLDRVIGLAGAARLTSPPQLVQQMRERLLPFVPGGDA